MTLGGGKLEPEDGKSWNELECSFRVATLSIFLFTDTDENGHLNLQELSTLMELVMLDFLEYLKEKENIDLENLNSYGKIITTQITKQLFSLLDLDRDEKMSFEEVRNFVN